MCGDGLHLVSIDFRLRTYVNILFFFSSRRRHTRLQGDWSSDVCSSDLDIARPSDDCLMFLAERSFNGEEVLKLQALARGEGPAELADADLLDLLMALDRKSVV